MGHIIGSDGLKIRRMYIYVINKDGHCAFQYLIHFFCLIKMDQKWEKSTLIVCAQLCVLHNEQNNLAHNWYMLVWTMW